MEQWIAEGKHGNMTYLERNRDLRYDIRLLVPGAQTVIVGLLTFEHCGHDYHRAVKSKLYELEAALHPQVAETQHIFCDSAPVLERRWAVEAGLGFIGRNHQLIHPTLGSLVHPGELVINEVIESPISNTPPFEGGDGGGSLCLACTSCLAACPNHALDGEWDARQCQAYVTHKCLACQLACPYNNLEPSNYRKIEKK